MTQLKVYSKKISIIGICVLFNTIVSPNAWSQKVLIEDDRSQVEVGREVSGRNKSYPEVGKQAAQKYFTKTQAPTLMPSSRLISLHWGGYINSKAYEWGKSAVTERVGDQSVGVTYKLGEWSQSMDLSMRVDYMQYTFANKNPIKLSLLPLFTFPESSAHFPLYFGGGIGMGAFLTQMENESNLSLDYQLVFGLRMQDIWGHSGFFIESGIKDHLHLLSDGQFTGQFLGAGAVFSL